jgi:carbonic anhydrase
MNADQALQQLLEGNQRYRTHVATHPHLTPERRAEVAQGQQPFAIIFSCVDSRVPPELIFDQGLGDLFVIRTAGQVLDNAVLGSIEFGVEELHIPLIVVLGHTRCGAVTAAVDFVTKYVQPPGQIRTIAEGLRPAVEKVRWQGGDLIDKAVRVNVELIVDRLRHSPLLANTALTQGRLKIVGAVYDLVTGIVEVNVP